MISGKKEHNPCHPDSVPSLFPLELKTPNDLNRRRMARFQRASKRISSAGNK